MGKIILSETFVVGFDRAANGDETVLKVARVEGRKISVVHTFRGEEAENEYSYLVGLHPSSSNDKEVLHGI